MGKTHPKMQGRKIGLQAAQIILVFIANNPKVLAHSCYLCLFLPPEGKAKKQIPNFQISLSSQF